MRPSQYLIQALYDVAEAAEGDSNDAHIEALDDALAEALDLLASTEDLTVTDWLEEGERFMSELGGWAVRVSRKQGEKKNELHTLRSQPRTASNS